MRKLAKRDEQKKPATKKSGGPKVIRGTLKEAREFFMNRHKEVCEAIRKSERHSG
jgi:hypothetical protein